MFIVVTTGHQFKAAVTGEEDSCVDLLEFMANSTPEELEVWKEMEQASQATRLTNPEAMDIYDINPGEAAVTWSTLQISLLEDEDQNGARKGKTTWLALGLKLVEVQCVVLCFTVSILIEWRLALRTDIRQQGPVLSTAKKLQITTKQQNLDTRLDSFIEYITLPHLFRSDSGLSGWIYRNLRNPVDYFFVCTVPLWK